MKQTFILVLASILSLSSYSQHNPPRKIIKTFESKYAEARDLTWKKTGEHHKETEWRAEYVLERDTMATLFDYKGNWIRTLKFIPTEALPEAIQAAISEEYMNAELLKAARLEEPDLSSYGVAIDYKGNRMEIQYREDGRILRRRIRSEGFEL